MHIEGQFTAPDYYAGFHCKGGLCRHSCCHGLRVSISRADYYHMLGVDCSKEIKGRLDCALKLYERPSPSRYAFINPNWEGNCPLLGQDGYCLLHQEAGEQALSLVCRLFPRGPRLALPLECSCSNSCEAVLEILYRHPDPLTFSPLHLSFDTPEPAQPPQDPSPLHELLRKGVIAAMQDRSRPLYARLKAVGQLLEQAGQDDHQSNVRALPLHKEQAGDFCLAPFFENKASRLQEFLAFFASHHDHLSPYALRAREALAAHDGLQSLWTQATKAFPALPVFVEQAMVNHLFYSRFPFSSPFLSFAQEWASITAIYGLLILLLSGAAHWGCDESGLIDPAASLFRVVEHTDFDRHIALLSEMGGSGPAPRAG